MSSVGTRGGRPHGIVIYVTSDEHPELDVKSKYYGIRFEFHNIVDAARKHREEILLRELESLP